MCNNKKYIMVTFFFIFSLVFLIFENYRVEKVLSEKQNKITKIEMKEKNKDIPTKKFGYIDIINTFENQEGLKITKLNQQKDENTASVELDIVGDISLIEKFLKNIEKKENFQSIKNIEIEKREDNSITTRLNMNFIKNK